MTPDADYSIRMSDRPQEAAGSQAVPKRKEERRRRRRERPGRRSQAAKPDPAVQVDLGDAAGPLDDAPDGQDGDSPKSTVDYLA